MNQTMFIRVILAICFMVYPFIVYFGIRFLPPSFFGLVLTVLLALRFGVLVPQERPILLPVLIIFLGYAVLTTALKSTQMLLFYPALVNFCLCAVFANSLRHEESLLLRIVRARGLPIDKHVPQYLFRLTALWAVFFCTKRDDCVMDHHRVNGNLDTLQWTDFLFHCGCADRCRIVVPKLLQKTDGPRQYMKLPDLHCGPRA